MGVVMAITLVTVLWLKERERKNKNRAHTLIKDSLLPSTLQLRGGES